jgi:hypothetical protein
MITDVVFLRELDGDDIFALFPAHAACVGRTDLMVCYSRIGQHSSASYDYCDECDEVTDPDEYADLFAELERRDYELCVICKDRMNDSKYADSRRQEAAGEQDGLEEKRTRKIIERIDKLERSQMVRERPEIDWGGFVCQ